jgi:hypothetical protein
MSEEQKRSVPAYDAIALKLSNTVEYNSFIKASKDKF